MADASDPRFSRRLSIVVPYRDRAEHLAQFVPSILNYFTRDKLDRQIKVTINIIEQQGTAPFNLGRLANAGYILTRGESDYTCIHCVDYFPIWADYAWSPNPARLVWYGLSIAENRERFFGGAVLVDNPVFERANGYANGYWGWGFEDTDFRLRLEAIGCTIEHRDGTYGPLPHPHAGYKGHGVWTEAGARNHALFESRKPRLAETMAADGLTTHRSRLVTKSLLPIATGTNPGNVWHYLVDVGTPEGLPDRP